MLAADYTVAEPRGVAVLLTPWNDPVAVACGLIGAALVTGNTAFTNLASAARTWGSGWGKCCRAVFPPNVLLTLTGGADVGTLLTQQAAVDVFAHVGSSDAGARIARAAVLTGAHVIRENGGNDPLLVDDGRGSRVGRGTGGDRCLQQQRTDLHVGGADLRPPGHRGPVLRGPRRAGPEPQPGRQLAPLVDTRMRDSRPPARGRGACGSARGRWRAATVPDGPGAFYPATVLLDCTDSMDVMAEETFGPVAPVRVVDSFEEGLSFAAAGRYGLAATVLTGQHRPRPAGHRRPAGGHRQGQ